MPRPVCPVWLIGTECRLRWCNISRTSFRGQLIIHNFWQGCASHGKFRLWWVYCCAQSMHCGTFADWDNLTELFSRKNLKLSVRRHSFWNCAKHLCSPMWLFQVVRVRLQPPRKNLTNRLKRRLENSKPPAWSYKCAPFFKHQKG